MVPVRTLPPELLALPPATQRAYKGLYRALRKSLESDFRFAHKLRKIGIPRHVTALQSRARCYLNLNIADLQCMIKKLGDLRFCLRQLLSKGVGLQKSRMGIRNELDQHAVELRSWSTWAMAVLEAEAGARELVVEGFAGKTTLREREQRFQNWRSQLLYVSQAQSRMCSIQKRYEQLVGRVEQVNTLLEEIRESTEAVKAKIERLMMKIREEEKRVNQRAMLLGLEKLDRKSVV